LFRGIIRIADNIATLDTV